ncbi:hypothetical protein CDEST_07683 [Colletotrichum destructivum]|uniref:Uncharacterized protein n=1 Tax=Colletotrichum destructivum TaxID=34406 RepID=A0AAX4IH56_9PEZI|nr:hypothetical protein CDEST_07683 [Colletotrichum destructivum]
MGRLSNMSCGASRRGHVSHAVNAFRSFALANGDHGHCFPPDSPLHPPYPPFPLDTSRTNALFDSTPMEHGTKEGRKGAVRLSGGVFLPRHGESHDSRAALEKAFVGRSRMTSGRGSRGDKKEGLE